MPRVVTTEALRARLGSELDALRKSHEALYVSKRGQLAAVVLHSEHYAMLVELLDYLEGSLAAALTVREEWESAVAWSEVRGPDA